MEFTAIVDYIETLIFYKLLKISRVTDAMGWEADAGHPVVSVHIPRIYACRKRWRGGAVVYAA